MSSRGGTVTSPIAIVDDEDRGREGDRDEACDEGPSQDLDQPFADGFGAPRSPRRLLFSSPRRSGAGFQPLAEVAANAGQPAHDLRRTKPGGLRTDKENGRNRLLENPGAVPSTGQEVAHPVGSAETTDHDLDAEFEDAVTLAELEIEAGKDDVDSLFRSPIPRPRTPPPIHLLENELFGTPTPKSSSMYPPPSSHRPITRSISRTLRSGGRDAADRHNVTTPDGLTATASDHAAAIFRQQQLLQTPTKQSRSTPRTPRSRADVLVDHELATPSLRRSPRLNGSAKSLRTVRSVPSSVGRRINDGQNFLLAAHHSSTTIAVDVAGAGTGTGTGHHDLDLSHMGVLQGYTDEQLMAALGDMNAMEHGDAAAAAAAAARVGLQLDETELARIFGDGTFEPGETWGEWEA